jgi:hypothetical protein
MDEVTVTTATAHGLEVGDVVEFSVPRPRWWRLVALYRWWRDPMRKIGRRVITSVVSSELQADVLLGPGEDPPPWSIDVTMVTDERRRFYNASTGLFYLGEQMARDL